MRFAQCSTTKLASKSRWRYPTSQIINSNWSLLCKSSFSFPGFPHLWLPDSILPSVSDRSDLTLTSILSMEQKLSSNRCTIGSGNSVFQIPVLLSCTCYFSAYFLHFIPRKFVVDNHVERAMSTLKWYPHPSSEHSRISNIPSRNVSKLGRSWEQPERLVL